MPPEYIPLPPWYTDDWDTAIFNDQTSPGLVKIVDPARGPKWDRKPVAGQTGETQTFKGWNNADFKIEIRTWTTDQHADFLARILPLLEPEPGKEAPKEVAIQHPATSARKIESFKIDKLTGPSANYEDGYTLWTIDAFQALKKVPQKGGGGGPAKSTCQEIKAAYEQSVAILNIAIVEWNNLLINLAPADQIEASNARMIYAQTDVENCKRMLEEQGCNNAPPSATPPPTP